MLFGLIEIVEFSAIKGFALKIDCYALNFTEFKKGNLEIQHHTYKKIIGNLYKCERKHGEKFGDTFRVNFASWLLKDIPFMKNIAISDRTKNISVKKAMSMENCSIDGLTIKLDKS